MAKQKNENEFQRILKRRLKERFKGCIVLKNDPNCIQGIPDLLILFNEHWAALEVKKSAKAKHRPNQDMYIQRMNTMSYASFVYPENMEEVINDLAQSFGA